MKNLINFYYNLIPTNIHQKDDTYELIINNKKYIFAPFYGNIDNIRLIYNYLLSLNIYCHEIIYNKENNIITPNNNKQYILIQIHYDYKKTISIQDIISYNILVNTNQKCNWKKLWSEKLDYYEYQLREYGKKYPIIRDSFSYYDGLCETAISLLNTTNLDNINMYISHQRITKNMNIIQFYNPLDLVLDVRIRDISEYFKIKFFEGYNTLSEIEKYLYDVRLDYNESLLLFIRLLYPSYYFDMYDKIIQGKEKEEKINIYIDKIDDYEVFLQNTYIVISKYYKLPEIEWLIKT